MTDKTVTQEDREAARELREEIQRQVGPRPGLDVIEDADFDVQLLATHRLAHQPAPDAEPYRVPHHKFAAIGNDDLWLLKFADPDCGDQWFGGEGYEPGEARNLAIEAWNRYAPAWSIRLMRTVRMDELSEANPPSPAPADVVHPVGGSEIWEILFGLLKGDVPDALTEDVLSGLASALNAAMQGDARHD